jgi:hypothetical protein
MQHVFALASRMACPYVRSMRRFAWWLGAVLSVVLGCNAGPPRGFRCVDCLASTDCGDEQVCIQYASDVACADACTGGAACATGTHCASFSSVAGEQVMACVPDVPACGMIAQDTGPDVDAGMPTSCGGLVAPTVTACCACPTGHQCAANGCYGGWWCNTGTCHCQAAPVTCGPPPVDGGPPIDAGPPPVGSVGPSGGTVSSLFFSVLGDSRPSMPTTTTAGYPTAIVTRLYQDLAALSPQPQFAIVTGDYCFIDYSMGDSVAATAAHDQMQLYLGARAMFPNTVFFAMGNHECTGGTSSNCGPQGQITPNYSSFLGNMLAPIGQANPYYAIRVDSTSGAWTSKIIFAAPNAWSQAQMDFLTTQLAIPTTYTFVVSHEPPNTTSGPPGLAPLNTLIASANPPVTLHITGHSHTYYHQRGTNVVVIGLGGAPPAGSYDYGYLTVTQLGTGDIEVAEFDYMTAGRNDVWRVHPDGTAAP